MGPGPEYAWAAAPPLSHTIARSSICHEICRTSAAASFQISSPSISTACRHRSWVDSAAAPSANAAVSPQLLALPCCTFTQFLLLLQDHSDSKL